MTRSMIPETEKPMAKPAAESDPPEEGVVLLADSGRRHLFDNPANVKRLIRGFWVACGLLLALDLLFLPGVGPLHKHMSFAEGVLDAEDWPGFFCFYGLGACVALVLLAKLLRKVIMRREDYYDR